MTGSQQLLIPPEVKNPIYESGSLVRLKTVRESLRQGLLSIYDIPDIYEDWVSQDEGLVIEREINGVFEIKGVKCAKRGNDVYRWRVNDRLKGVKGLFQNKDNDFFSVFEKKPMVNCLNVTLTYDVKRCSIAKAWGNIGKEYNKFISRLRSKYGNIDVIRAWEAYENGYPHVHMILLFNDHKFNGFKFKNDDVRIQEKDDIDKAWHSHTDISGIQNLSKSGFYLTKYITKLNNVQDIPKDELEKDKASRKKHRLTMSMMWLHNKRAFGISGSFLSNIKQNRLDFALHNSNFKHQTTLDLSSGLSDVMKYSTDWKLVGVYKWSDIWKVAKKDQKKESWVYDCKNRPESSFKKFDCPRDKERIINMDCRDCKNLLNCKLGGFEIKHIEVKNR